MAGPRFVGIDMKFAGAPAPSMIPLTYAGDRLPFANGAFHTVLSMDTLEHVPPAQRRSFIQDLTRVSSARVIFGFPAVGDAGGDGREGERYLQGLFRALGMGDPDWLREHEELGLPHASEVDEILNGLEGWTWRRLPTTGNLVNLMTVLIDILPGTRPWVAPVLEARGAELEAWLRAGSFGPADRVVYALERRQPAAPLVNLGGSVAPWGAVARALACPDCAGAFEQPAPAAPELVCGGCRRRFPRDPHGILGLVPSPGPMAFHMAPDWRRSASWITPVRNYLKAFSPNDPCVLWLEVDPAQLSCAQALQLLRPLLGEFGDRPFAEIYLNDDPRARPRGSVVAIPAGDHATHGSTPEWFRAQARHRLP